VQNKRRGVHDSRGSNSYIAPEPQELFFFRFSRPQPPPLLLGAIMRQAKTSTAGRLAKALDTKVLSLVRQFVSEQSSDEPTLQLKLSAILAYVSSDPSLTRHKKLTLEKSIERALGVICEEEDDSDDAELDSDFEGLEVGNLMLPDEKQSNAVNKRITDMWGLNSGTTSDAGKASVPPTPKTELSQPVVEPVGMTGAVTVPPPLGSPKRKRREKGEEGRPKRQKGANRAGGDAQSADTSVLQRKRERIVSRQRIYSSRTWEA